MSKKSPKQDSNTEADIQAASQYAHRPVLLDEALTALNVIPAGVYIDATFGRGGHTQAMLARLSKQGFLLAFDKDPQAIQAATQLFPHEPRLTMEHGSFSCLQAFVEGRGLSGKVNGVLLDLGVSSPQLDDPQRGFSFRREGPLDMRMDPTNGLSAAQWLAMASEREIVEVLRTYGEEDHAKRIARAIVEQRVIQPIDTTGALQALVAQAKPSREKGKDPATQTFQAIRIFINRELDDLAACLPQAMNVLAPGGRLVVISFHSLEDRIVKRFMRNEARGDDFPKDFPVRASELKPQLRVVGKAVRAGTAEIAVNPRARSAVMRVAEKRDLAA